MEEKIEEQQEITEAQEKFKLSNFEGPLDLLLHLIKEAKLDIADVKLAEITEQYLEFMQDIETLDLDKASSFIVMAATLIEIKSKHVLPVFASDDAEEEDGEALLLRQLQEYKLFKEASESLKQIEDVNKLWRMPDKSVQEVKYVLKEMLPLDSMLDAFALLMQRVALKETVILPKEIKRDRFTVAEKIAAIKDTILITPVFKFTDMFDDDLTKSEIINVFLALLELLKMQVVKICQTEIFGEIEIRKYDYEPEEN